jgi:Acetyltransferase (GNAT) domain
MLPLISPIPVEVLLTELNAATFLRKTNKGDKEIYVVNQRNAPNTIQEIGRLRELTFRESGGGTGMPLDIDNFDTDEFCYEQMIVWNPEDKEILGGYRYKKCADAVGQDGKLHLSTIRYFNFSEEFMADYFAKTIELGRSFIQPEYQNKDGNRKGLFSLDNLWDGLGALIVLHKDVNYFFGKVTIYPQFPITARDTIIGFMHHYFPDKTKLVTSKAGLKKEIVTDISEFINSLEGKDYKAGHVLLVNKVRELGAYVPPLINSYMNLSTTMRTFESAGNEDFGNVEETGILIDMRDIYPTKKDRHVDTFIQSK